MKIQAFLLDDKQRRKFRSLCAQKDMNPSTVLRQLVTRFLKENTNEPNGTLY